MSARGLRQFQTPSFSLVCGAGTPFKSIWPGEIVRYRARCAACIVRFSERRAEEVHRRPRGALLLLEGVHAREVSDARAASSGREAELLETIEALKSEFGAIDARNKHPVDTAAAVSEGAVKTETAAHAQALRLVRKMEMLALRK